MQKSCDNHVQVGDTSPAMELQQSLVQEGDAIFAMFQKQEHGFVISQLTKVTGLLSKPEIFDEDEEVLMPASGRRASFQLGDGILPPHIEKAITFPLIVPYDTTEHDLPGLGQVSVSVPQFVRQLRIGDEMLAVLQAVEWKEECDEDDMMVPEWPAAMPLSISMDDADCHRKIEGIFLEAIVRMF